MPTTKILGNLKLGSQIEFEYSIKNCDMQDMKDMLYSAMVENKEIKKEMLDLQKECYLLKVFSKNVKCEENKKVLDFNVNSDMIFFILSNGENENYFFADFFDFEFDEGDIELFSKFLIAKLMKRNKKCDCSTLLKSFDFVYEKTDLYYCKITKKYCNSVINVKVYKK